MNEDEARDLTYKVRFAIAYTLIAVLAVLVAAATYYAATHPRPPVTRKDLAEAKAEAAAAAKEAAGDQNLYAICEAYITNAVTSSYGTVKGYKPVSVKPGKTANESKVVVKLTSDIYTGNVTCTLTKSNWNVQGIAT